MEITINNQNYTLTQSYTLAQLISGVLHLEKTGIAIAINQNIVPKPNWAVTSVQANDEITIIKPTQGG